LPAIDPANAALVCAGAALVVVTAVVVGADAVVEVGGGVGVDDDDGAALGVADDAVGVGLADGLTVVPVRAAMAFEAFTRPPAMPPPLSGSVVPVIALVRSPAVALGTAAARRPASPATTGDAEEVPPKLKVFPLGATV
jgi:hypothetical protein